MTEREALVKRIKAFRPEYDAKYGTWVTLPDCLVDEIVAALQPAGEQEARRLALEEAAKVCEEKGAAFTIHNFTIPDTGKSAASICAAAIRSLAAHPAEPAWKES